MINPQAASSVWFLWNEGVAGAIWHLIGPPIIIKIVVFAYVEFANLLKEKKIPATDRPWNPEESAIRMIPDDYGPPEQKDKKIRK